MIIKKNLLISVLMFLLSSCFSFASAESLGELVEEAIGNNPQIQAAYNRWQAAKEKARHVSGLPDPQASYAYFGENIETKVGPQEAQYGLSQKVPFPGKLGLKAKAESKHADMLRERYEAAKRELIKNVKFAYYDLFWIDKAIEITENEKGILESLERVAQRRYESNLSPLQDVVKAQVEISKLIDKLFLLRQNRKGLEARMNSLLNRAKKRELGKVQHTPALEFRYKPQELHEIARVSSQNLQAANLDIERAEYEKSLARLDYFPDFTLGVDYIQIGGGDTAMPNDGDDAWRGMVAVSLPLWFGKLNAQIKEKSAALEANKKLYENVENNLTYEIEDLYFKIVAYKDIVSLYKTALIPQTEQLFEAARTSYETGEVGFLDWLDAERVLLETRLAHYKAVIDYQKSIAYLEKVIGKDLD